MSINAGIDLSSVPAPANLSAEEYEQLRRRVQETIRNVLPSDATVLVVSRGDGEFLELDGRPAWHFPQDETGKYAGYHPKDSEAAIAHLEELRERGAEYLVFPATSFWWLEHYTAFREYLSYNFPTVLLDASACLILALSDRPLEWLHDQGTSAPDVAALDGSMMLQIMGVIGALVPNGAPLAMAGPRDTGQVKMGDHVLHPFPLSTHMDASAQIAQLEALRENGVRFLVAPQTTFEELRRRPELSEHLSREHFLITEQHHLFLLYELRPPRQPTSSREGPSSRERRKRSLWSKLTRSGRP